MGIKVTALSNAFSAYIYCFPIYCSGSVDSDTASIGMCSHSVLDLLKGLNNLELQLLYTP